MLEGKFSINEYWSSVRYWKDSIVICHKCHVFAISLLVDDVGALQYTLLKTSKLNESNLPCNICIRNRCLFIISFLISNSKNANFMYFPC